MKIFVGIIAILGGLLVAAYTLAGMQAIPPADAIRYGTTYSVFRSNELKLDWKHVYDALIDDLKVRKFRFVAHWDLTEIRDDVYDLATLDYQMKRAEEVGAEVTLAIGRRLPSWPECHIPDWAQDLTPDERDAELLEYMAYIIDRYKNSSALKRWQVENEPFIIGYAYQNCGSLDVDFLDKEITFVKEMDPNHPVLLTASGELGVWNGTWDRADVFGTTLYRYVYNADLKAFITYPTTPGFFRAKRTLTELMTGEKKPAIISELGAEPWPTKAIIDTPLNEQLERMNLERFDGIIDFASRTSFDEQYLWGAEWWYYLKEVHGRPEFWERARELFSQQ